MRRRLATVLVTLALTLPAGPAWAATATPDTGFSAPLRTAVTDLPVAAEVRTGYLRTLFPHWIDADHNGCNTRFEVLIAEATTAPTVSASCKLTGGRWYSWYDDASWTDPADLDIDHFVPLAEAWDSGARDWTTARRQAFANDLDDPRTLDAVTDNVNQEKGDQDPATWLPSFAPNRCRYVDDWVAVKTRWRLSVDAAERDALVDLAASCPDVTITVAYAD